MTSAWQYPVHSHPWFRMPSLKRKVAERDSSSSSSSDYSDYERYIHPTKRLRCGMLENGFAQLSLTPTTIITAPIVTEPPLSKYSTRPQPGLQSQGSAPAGSFSSSSGITWDGTTYDATQSDPYHTQSVVLPGTVEEPTSPEVTTTEQHVPDVAMKSRSWYEPEKDRIVVVDLDDSDVEESADDREQPRVTVNSALLSRIKEQSSRESSVAYTSSSRKEADSSMALVLFKPLPIPDSGRDSDTREGDHDPSTLTAETPQRTVENSPVIQLDVDLVDIDSAPMDVDDAMDIEY